MNTGRSGATRMSEHNNFFFCVKKMLIGRDKGGVVVVGLWIYSEMSLFLIMNVINLHCS